MPSIRDLILQPPTFEEISAWAFSCGYFEGYPTVHEYTHPEVYSVPKYLFEVVEKGGKTVVIRGEERTFRLLCGAYMSIMQELAFEQRLRDGSLIKELRGLGKG
jgi:hypothetical protein